MLNRITRIGLKKRILIAVVAIVLIHLGFYFVPRWWATRPRVYPEAYERAVSIIEAEFGEAAVEKGIITIRREPIVVPYEGVATVFAGIAFRTIHLRLSPERSFVVVERFGEPLKAVEVSSREARRIWATLLYLNRFETTIEGDGASFVFPTTTAEFFDQTWPPNADSKAAFERVHMQDYSVEAVIAHAVNACDLESLIGISEESLATEEDLLRDAVKSLAESPFPSPYRRAPRRGREPVMAYYVQSNGKNAVEFIRKREAPGALPFEAAMHKFPPLGRWLDEKRRFRIASTLYAPHEEIWAVEALSGKTEKEATEILREAAFNGSNWSVRKKARQLLASKDPEAWQDLLVEKYDELGEEQTRDCLYGLQRGGMPFVSDERFARLAIADPMPEMEIAGRVRLYELTQDAALLEDIKSILLSDGVRGYRSFDALQYLVSTQKTQESTRVVEEFFRDIFRRKEATAPFADSTRWRNLAHFVLNAFPDEPHSYERLLLDIRDRPESVFGPECDRNEVDALRMTAGAMLFHGRRGREQPGSQYEGRAVDAYLDLIEERLDSAEAGAIDGIRGQLYLVGGPRGLAMLERIARQEGYDDMTPGANGWQVLHHMMSLRIGEAEDVGEYIRSLPESERRWLWSQDFTRMLSREELKTLLVDDGCVDVRNKICTAIYELRREELQRANQ